MNQEARSNKQDWKLEPSVSPFVYVAKFKHSRFGARATIELHHGALASQTGPNLGEIFNAWKCCETKARASEWNERNVFDRIP